jgi:hypothetical protein
MLNDRLKASQFFCAPLEGLGFDRIILKRILKLGLEEVYCTHVTLDRGIGGLL